MRSLLCLFIAMLVTDTLCVPVRCPKDVKKCPDGSEVSRDPKERCRFPKCNCRPKGWTRASSSSSECEDLYYTCKRNFIKWSHDECGCGCKPRPCRMGTRTCPDGSKVERDPKENCRFPKCACPPKGWTMSGGPKKCKTFGPGEPKCKRGEESWSNERCGCGCKPIEKCDKEPKTCPNGSKVYRNPKNNCEFPKCEPVFCTADVKECPDGSSVPRVGPNCEFAECPVAGCPEDLKTCADGSTVVRDPKKNCTFPACECPPKGWTRVGGPKECRAIKYLCKEGYVHWFHGECGCGCKPKKPVFCTADVKKCPDGSFVTRVGPNCEFAECPVGCPEDVKTCLDGSTVVRDPKNNCTFPACECPPKGWTLIRDPKTCPLINLLCDVNTEDPVKCKKELYNCQAGYETWSGPEFECGCGCKPPAIA